MEFLVSIMFSVSYIANYGSSTVATEPRVSGHSRDRGTAYGRFKKGKWTTRGRVCQ